MGEVLSQNQEMSPFAKAVFARTYAFYLGETWHECAARVAKAVASDTKQEQQFYEMIRDRIFVPGGRYLYCSGRPIQQFSNCFGLIPGDSREDWASTLHDAVMCLSMGGGIGVNYSRLRSKGSPVGRMGGVASGPVSLAQMVNEVARHVMAGGARRSALWAGLDWTHADIQEFIQVKDWDSDIRALKAKRYEAPAPLDMTNMSVIIGEHYLQGLERHDPTTWDLHRQICHSMARTGEPAFRNQSLILRDDPTGYGGNPCQESTLGHRSVCNLGSIVLSRIRDLSHLEEVTRLATQFLINGSVRGDYPVPEISERARIERRIGLGFMGLHEWMLMRGYRYEWSEELARWLSVWKAVNDEEADRYADRLGERRPWVRRAVAPTGTISIIAQTTSGIEPVYCTAYKRRYLNGDQHYFQFVIDPTAKRLLDDGVLLKDIEDAYQLSHDFTRRLEVQAQVQTYVDQAISSTVNVPEWSGSDNGTNPRIAEVIASYLPRLKGLTIYPDKARPGQPLVPVSFEEAREQEGVVFEESGECSNGVCGL